MRRRSFVSCLRPAYAAGHGEMRAPQPPPLLAPAGGDLYSELDDLLLIDRPAGDDRTAVRPASVTAVRDGRF